MPGPFPRLSRLVTRILEIVGAGCASAYAAVLLGNSHEPPRAAPQPPAVVRLAPADEQMIRHVRDESVLLAEQLRNAADALNAAAPTAPVAAPAAKAAKASAAPPARKEQKPNRPTTELRQRPVEPLPIQSAMASPRTEPARLPAGAAAASDTRDGRIAAAVAAGESGAPSAQTQVLQTQVPQTQVPSRIWPAAASSLRDAPRPPLGVGGFSSSSM